LGIRFDGDRYSQCQEEGEDCSNGFAFGGFGWGVGLSALDCVGWVFVQVQTSALEFTDVQFSDQN
jgi:hypothetical protein